MKDYTKPSDEELKKRLSPDQYQVTQTITTPQFSRNLGLDPTNHRLFVAAAKFGPAPAGGRGRGPLLTDSFSVLVIGK